MNVVDPNNYWDGIMNGVDPGGAEFADILDVLNFPIESVEGDDLGEEDLDPSKFENLGGPIPMDALTVVPPVCQGNIGNSAANMVPSYGAPINIKSGGKELANNVEENSVTTTPCQNLVSPESSAFQTPSPISVLESGGSCLSAKSLSTIADRPVRARSKRARKSTVNPWLYISPMIFAAVSKKSSNTRENREKKRRKLSQPSNAMEGIESFSLPAMKQLPEQLAHPMQNKDASLRRSVVTKKCTHCEATTTPQWREGPLGPKTLCNACGVRYRSGRLFPEYRPAASPTFRPTLHSNSHKKVIAMRKKAMQQAAVGEDPPMSPLPEFIPTSSYLLDYIC